MKPHWEDKTQIHSGQISTTSFCPVNGLQRAQRCAAEHMTYSSVIGGFKWDTGRYDAYETVMEVSA